MGSRSTLGLWTGSADRRGALPALQHVLAPIMPFIDRAALLKYQVIFVDLIRPVTVKCLAVVVQQPSHHLVPCRAQATNICPLMFLVRSTADCLPLCIISALWVQPPLPMTVNMTIR